MNEELALSTDQLRNRLDPEQFDFDSTADLDPLDEVIGQDRAMEAVHFGAEIEQPGYNIFALGPRGSGKKRTIRESLEEQAADEPAPSDWVFVNNFERPDRPRALELPTGRGHELRDDMDTFVQELRTDVPDLFDSDEYQQERENIQGEFEQAQKELLQELEERAQEKNFTVLQTQGGHMLAPVVDGEVMTPDQFSSLDEETMDEINSNREELQDTYREITQQIQSLQQEAREKIHELDRRMIHRTVKGLIDQLKQKYRDVKQVTNFLDAALEDLIDNVHAFKQLRQSENQQQPVPPFMQQQQQTFNFDKYRVNLIIDHGDSESAPVVVESNPTYYNLLGKIEHEGQLGELHTDFTMIKDGALHRANGGYLIVEIKDLLTKPFAWEALKRSLKNQHIKTETMGQEYRAIQTTTLEPEPIPLDTRVVLLGPAHLYYLLCNLDEEFCELFKVKADFGERTELNEAVAQQYAQFIGGLCEKEDLSHFDRSAVVKVIEESIRDVHHKEKISTRFKQIADLVRQSNFWAKKNGNDHVTEHDVEKAIDREIVRANRVEERVREEIDEGTILIDTDGEEVGQVNGLSVLPLGDYRFGKPSRITARTHPGSEGVINIDREAELGGPIHNKGMMILSGYLQGEFSRDRPLALSASIAFEQQYSPVDGDSASSTELYALLSSLADIPIRQDIAVTGSINQHGTVQAIGGVNEKIEGFYHVCKNRGLTGEQGVVIPKSNVKHLMLRAEVLTAISDGRFHVYAVDHVDQGLELLTGTPAGERQADGTYPEGTVKHTVAQRLDELAEAVKEFSTADRET